MTNGNGKGFFKQIKENWAIILFIVGLASAAGGTVARLYVGNIALEQVKSEVAAAHIKSIVTGVLVDKGITTSSTITKMSSDISKNAENIEENRDQITKVEDKAERIAQILMED